MRHPLYDIFGALSACVVRADSSAEHCNVARRNVDPLWYWFFLFDVLVNPFYNQSPIQFDQVISSP